MLNSGKFWLKSRFKSILEAGYKNCCLFGIYDGHGGNQCCNYLKEYLFSHILNEETFCTDPVESMKKSFKDLDVQFMDKIQKTHPLDCSGSCAVVLMVLDNILYFMNVGDSRGILSQRGGSRIVQCTRDHKPQRDSEAQRIFQNDGIVYR